jgi:hypothetical protein
VDVRHLTRAELDAGLEAIRNSPKDNGTVELIVSRPQPGARVVLDDAQLDPASGMITDSWATRVAAPDPATQLTVMNARAIALIAQDRARWPLAGDQLFVDLDLADDNLPPGTQLEIGSAVIEVSVEPHTGCGKSAGSFTCAASTRAWSAPARCALAIARASASDQHVVARAGSSSKNRLRSSQPPAEGHLWARSRPAIGSTVFSRGSIPHAAVMSAVGVESRARYVRSSDS